MHAAEGMNAKNGCYDYQPYDPRACAYCHAPHRRLYHRGGKRKASHHFDHDHGGKQHGSSDAWLKQFADDDYANPLTRSLHRYQGRFRSEAVNSIVVEGSEGRKVFL